MGHGGPDNAHGIQGPEGGVAGCRASAGDGLWGYVAWGCGMWACGLPSLDVCDYAVWGCGGLGHALWVWCFMPCCVAFLHAWVGMLWGCIAAL